MEVRLLGPVAVWRDGAPVDLGGRKQRSLFALLAAHAGEVVSIDRCIDAVWGDSAPKGAGHSLQTYVSNLRRLLDPADRSVIEMVDGGYRFPRPEVVDAHRFERLVADADPASLRPALELWAGEPLGDLGDATWAALLVSRWRELHRQAELALIDSRLAAGEAEELVGDLETMIEDDPLREPVWGRYMTALYRAGRQADALRAYQRLRHILGEELGIEPGAELADLEERLLLQDPTLERPITVPTNLPAALTPLIGRHTEVEAVGNLMERTRLLTITGPGGSGKTTTTLEVARRSLSRYSDGVYLLELASLSDGSLIPTQLLGAMGLPTPVGRSHLSSLCSELADQRVLLVLDNCEHLVEEVAGLAVAVLKAAPKVRILATSRRPLGVSGELTWHLPPMALPPEGTTDPDSVAASDAGALFTARATAAGTGFRLDADTAPAVARICRRLDGLPLALELAAARTRVLALDQLEHRLADRFRLLTGGDPTEVPHHQTLLGTVQWSYELLDVPTQEMYRRLAVLPGDFDLSLVEAVIQPDPSDHVMDRLGRLVDDCLVVRTSTPAGVRFRMLETLRQHAQDLTEAAEQESTSAAMLAWVAGLVREGAPGLEGPEQAHWIAVFRAEMDTIRAALDWALQRDPATGLAVAAGIARFWWLHATETAASDDSTSYLNEGRDRLFNLLDATASDESEKLRGRALVALGGLLEVRLGLFEDALVRLAEARRLLTAAGDERMLGWAWFYTGVAAWDRSNLDASIEAFQHSLQFHSSAEDRAGMGFSTLLLGTALGVGGNIHEGRPLVERFAQGAMRSGIPNAVGHAEDVLALFDLLEGRTGEPVRQRIGESIRIFRELGNHACLAHALSSVGVFHALEGRGEEAARVFGVTIAIRDRLAMVTAPYEDRQFVADEAGFTGLDDPVNREAFDRGRSAPVAEGIEWALGSLEAG